MCSSRPRPPVAPPRSLWRGTSLAKARPTMSILNRKRFCSSSRASRDAADVLEAVHDVARDENDAAGTRLGGLIADGHLIEALDDEQNLFLFEMDMVGRAFAGLVPRHDDRGGAAGGLGGEEHIHVEAERLDRQRLFGRSRCA